MSMFINIFSVTTVSLSTLNIPSVIYPRQKRESLKIFQFPQRHKNFWPHIKNKIDIVYLDNNWKIQIINETHSTFLLLKYSKRNLQYENLDISMRKKSWVDYPELFRHHSLVPSYRMKWSSRLENIHFRCRPLVNEFIVIM